METVGVAPTTDCLRGSLAATAHVSPGRMGCWGIGLMGRWMIPHKDPITPTSHHPICKLEPRSLLQRAGHTQGHDFARPCVLFTQQRTNTFIASHGRRDGHGVSRWNVSVFSGTPPTKPLSLIQRTWDRSARTGKDRRGGNRLTHLVWRVTYARLPVSDPQVLFW